MITKKIRFIIWLTCSIANYVSKSILNTIKSVKNVKQNFFLKYDTWLTWIKKHVCKNYVKL